ncbi:TPA: hypothetical protein ACPSKZ_000661 [Legionella anisa]|nr:hypothetical protein [Legionella anisa]MCW8448930.1 hypothetical protein [Legionella anisa]
MLKGVLPIALLEQTVEVWRDNGMPDYAHGKTESYAAEKRRIKYAESQEKRALGYRGAFVDYRVMD